jgi:hypothetical protein
MSERSAIKWIQMVPALVAGIMLGAAIGRLPYWYYFYLRIVVFCASVYTGYVAYRRRMVWASCLLGVMGILFNPVVQLSLERWIWQVIDVACVVFLGVVVFLFIRSAAGRDSFEGD